MADGQKLVVGPDGPQMVPLSDADIAQRAIDEAAYQAALTAPPPIPQTVSNLQGRMALVGAGIFASVDAAIEALDHTSPAYLAWHYATVFQRNSPLMQSIASSLSIPDDQIDALFVAAAQINI